MADIKLCIEYLIRNAGTAVYCTTEDEAKDFILYVKEHYSSLCRSWDVYETHFDEYANGVGYTFYWKDDLRWNKGHLMYGRIESIRDGGYEVIDFSEFMSLGTELSESDQPIDSLFGGSVG